MHVRSCEAARVDRQTVWQERKSNPEFAALETAAREQADLSLVDEAVRRARDGVRTIKFNPKTGEPYLDPETGEPYVEHQYSDALLIRLLAAHMPKVYGNKVELETEVRHRRMTLDELEQRMKDARA